MMNRKLIATTTVSIHASRAKVWRALIDPELVKKYMYGAEVSSDWQTGSPITFSGVWEDRPFVDKGTILEIIPERVLSYSFWSPLSGTEDFEDNYAHITYHVDDYDGDTTVIVTQDNLETDEDVVKAEGNWMQVLHNLKNILDDDRKHVL